MEFYSFKSSVGSTLFDPYAEYGSGLRNGAGQGGGGGVVAQALVLDSERGELVKAPVGRVGKIGGGGVSEAKSAAALKNHSEAERRRRERINAHLSTLRGLVPCNEKMDKAALLAEVIRQVKELKKISLESSKGVLVPIDADEVKVEHYDTVVGDGTISLKASICCDYRPELLSDIKEALDSLHYLKMVKAEMATLGNRVHNVFVLTGCKDGNSDSEAYQIIASAIHHALNSVLDKGSVSPEYSPRTTLPSSKRRRISYLDNTSSSSS